MTKNETTETQNAGTALGDLATEEVESSASESTTEEIESSNAVDETAEASESLEKEDSTDEKEESKEQSEKPQKKNGGYQKKINKLTKSVALKEQEAEYWRREFLKTQKPAGAKEEAPVKAAATGKPKESDFTTHDDYIEAITDWKIEQREKTREDQARQAEAKTNQEKQFKSHRDRVDGFRKTHTDFDETLENVEDIGVSRAMQELIIGSENGPELMHALAQNREEFERINSLPPIAAARELGKFETKFLEKSSTSSHKKKTTSTPPPVNPVNAGKSGTRKSISDPNLSQAEYEAIRREQSAQRG